MENFKLVAIRPRKGCHASLLKNLSGDQLYTLYNSFNFYNSDGVQVDRTEGEIAFYNYNSKIPVSLYQIDGDENGIQFNLSAIAGKNGSGKSTLIELLFAAVFVMSQRSNILTPTEIETKYTINELNQKLKANDKRKKNLAKVKVGYANAYQKALSRDPTKIPFEEVEKGILEHKRREDLDDTDAKNLRSEIKKQKSNLEEFELMRTRTLVDVIFQVDNRVYQLELSPDKSPILRPIVLQSAFHLNELDDNSQPSLDNIGKLFCYSIAVNYSHYGLNSKNLGHWINLLFHKNDGYRTPLVITPMRNSGNFDINDEIGFAKARLLNNLIIQWNRDKEADVELVENQVVTQIEFRLNKSKINKIPKYVEFVNGKLEGDKRAIAMLNDYFKIALPDYQNSNFPDFTLREKLFNYIVLKIDKMSEYYPGFSPAYVYSEDPPVEHNKALLTKIFKDTSHVTYKLYQAVHFIEFCIAPGRSPDFEIQPNDLKGNKKVLFPFSFFDLWEWMGNPSEDELIAYLPPSIFEIDFKVTNSRGSSYSFNGLSSGEQQFVHTIQAVIYHLNNIQSAHANPERVKYEAVNIILDEIELYFHPDFQRSFISKLLRAIYRVNPKGERRIKTANLLFLTHSPFILSDIPNENVLRLRYLKSKGKTFPYSFVDKDEQGEETFAANIYDLLSNSFFIEGTAIGKFAEDKINAVIKKVNDKIPLTYDDELLIQLIGDKYLRFNIEEFTDKKGVGND